MTETSSKEKMLVFCQNNVWVIKNHGLGTHNGKMCPESSTGNTSNIPQFIRPICPNRPIIWNIIERSSHHMSIVHGQIHVDTEGLQILNVSSAGPHTVIKVKFLT